MPKRIKVELSEEQREELERVCRRNGKAYLRERASAVLKVAQGQSMNWVAEKGLLQRHEPETIKGWISRYLEQGLKGWQVRAGRGRKPAFSPSEQRTGAKRDRGQVGRRTKAVGN
jgi:hypothetical protein